jgi:hypothetical protein
MARLFADENFPHPVVEALRRIGHNVLTIQEAGMANQRIPDDEILRFASAEKRSVLTTNRKHFIRLHNTSPDHAGIIACTVDLDFAGQAARIHEAVVEQDSLREKLIRINRPA